MTWRAQAACVGHEDLFFPDTGQMPTEKRRQLAEKAKSFCAVCPVTVECGEYAVEKSAAFGIWGGQTMEERWGRPLREDGTCNVEGCPNKHAALGYCKTHWHRLKRYGNPHTLLRKGPKKKVSVDDLRRVEGMNNVQAGSVLGVNAQTVRRARLALVGDGPWGSDPSPIEGREVDHVS